MDPKTNMRGPLCAACAGACLLIWAKTVLTGSCFALIIGMWIIWTWIQFPEGVNNATSLRLMLLLYTHNTGLVLNRGTVSCSCSHSLLFSFIPFTTFCC